jgi:chromosome partitioning protein
MPKERMSWAEMLDVLTDSDRKKKIVVERATETERMSLFLLRRAGWSAQVALRAQKNYDLEIENAQESLVVQVRNQRAKVHLGQIEKFLDFLAHSDSENFTGGLFISTSGFTNSVYTHLREEKYRHLRLAILRENQLIWEPETVDFQEERGKTIYVGVFTCKGGVGKTTVSAHLAGAFALNGYDVALVDLDRQQNMRKLLGEGLYLPTTRGKLGSVISVLSPEEWDEKAYKGTKVVVCDCNPEFDSNPVEFIRKFDYCIVPTTLNPLGVNKNADVIKRTFNQLRRENAKAHLFVLINSLQKDEESRNIILNEILAAEFESFIERDKRCHYINPEKVAIRFSKQLLYWGFHIFDKSKPQLAFRSVGRYSYPRMDFLKLVDYLEMQTPIQKAKTFSALVR